MYGSFGRKDGNLSVNLFGDGQTAVCGEISASSCTAENAASGSKFSVPVGTGHPTV